MWMAWDVIEACSEFLKIMTTFGKERSCSTSVKVTVSPEEKETHLLVPGRKQLQCQWQSGNHMERWHHARDATKERSRIDGVRCHWIEELLPGDTRYFVRISETAWPIHSSVSKSYPWGWQDSWWILEQCTLHRADGSGSKEKAKQGRIKTAEISFISSNKQRSLENFQYQASSITELEAKLKSLKEECDKAIQDIMELEEQLTDKAWALNAKKI